MASPETTSAINPLSPSPEAGTVLASPLADRLIGPLMEMQQQQKMGQQGQAIRAMLKMLASQMMDKDPRAAQQLEQLAAKLITLLPQGGAPPTTPNKMAGAAGRMPSAAMGSFPPPAVSPPGAMPLGGAT